MNSSTQASSVVIPSTLQGPVAKVRTLLPGMGLSAMVAMAATLVSMLHGGPQFLYALFFGISLHCLSDDQKAKAGIEFCARGLLRFGVGLLGARITAGQIIALGWETALIVIAAVISTIALAILLGRLLGMSRAQTVLAGGAVAICGASAALAISAVLPREKDGDRFTLMVVVAVTLLSTIAMVVYPALAKLLGLSPDQAGLFLGGTIHDVAQVVGAGYTLSREAGDHATIVKLLRVALLTVVVVAVACAFTRQRHEARAARAQDHRPARQPLVPWFLWMFVAMVIANSIGMFSPVFQSGLNDASRACLVVAIAALGIKTSFSGLARLGWRPFMLLLVETVWMAALVLAIIEFRTA
jgi:Predicted membrane protein